MAALIAIITACGIIAAYVFATQELERQLKNWQDKLGLIAASRTADVAEWVQHHFQEVEKLSGNPSLQLYVAELAGIPPATTPVAEEPAQLVYLRNLLSVTAEQLGLTPSGSELQKTIKASIPSPSETGGLALLDKELKPIAVSGSLPPIEMRLLERLRNAPQGVSSLLDMQQTVTGSVQIGFIVPVFALHGEHDPAQQIATLLAIKPVEKSFFGILEHPGVTEKTLEISLIRPENQSVLYLSPLRDRTPPLSKRLDQITTASDAGFALAHPDGFGLKRDYRGQDVLVTGRKVPYTPWTLIAKINRDEALAEGDTWRTGVVTIFLLAVALVVASLIAVWRHASSRKAFELSIRSSKLATQTAAQEKLLRLVADYQPEPIFIADMHHRLRFGNQRTAEVAGMSVEELRGKTLESLFGPVRAKEYEEANQRALSGQSPFYLIKRYDTDTEQRIVRTQHIPLAHIPVEELPEPSPGVMVVEQDITEVVNERELRMRIMDQLIETLVTLVDQRDPFAAYHSSHVAQVAHAIALEMEMDPLEVEATEIAAKLMNIGKLSVPSEVLTKPDSLNAEEKQTVRESLSASADLLQNIDFDGPVVGALRQAQERWDGQGPLRLVGEDILMPARIIHVANDFVSMISPRSYRAPMSVTEATRILLDHIDTQFDRRVVVALINYLDNRDGQVQVRRMMARAQKKLSALSEQNMSS